MQYFGLAAPRAEADRGIDLAAHAEAVVRAEPGLEVLAPAQLGILCFRVRPPGLDDPAALDARNERVNTAVNATGRYLVPSARLRGALALGLRSIGHRTTAADVDGVLWAVVEAASRDRGGGGPIGTRHGEASGDA